MSVRDFPPGQIRGIMDLWRADHFANSVWLTRKPGEQDDPQAVENVGAKKSVGDPSRARTCNPPLTFGMQ